MVFSSVLHVATNVSDLSGKSKDCTNSKMIACSALSKEHRDFMYTASRKLCEDRREVFAHLRPRMFIRNVSSCVASQYNALRSVSESAELIGLTNLRHSFISSFRLFGLR